MLYYDKNNHCTISLNDNVKKMSSGEWWPGIVFGPDEKSYLKVSNVEKV